MSLDGARSDACNDVHVVSNCLSKTSAGLKFVTEDTGAMIQWPVYVDYNGI